GVDMAARAGVSGGATGNTLAGIGDWTAKTMQGAYGDYVNRLAPWLGQGTTVAAGLGNTYTGLGNALNQNYTGLIGTTMDAYKGIGEAQNDAAMADYVGSQNMWNAGMNLGRMVAGGATGGLAGSLGSGAFNLIRGQPGSSSLFSGASFGRG